MIYAKLPTLEAYTSLNEAIGDAKAYPDKKSGTEQYASENPTQQEDGSYLMEITSEVQEKYPEVLEGIELVEL